MGTPRRSLLAVVLGATLLAATVGTIGTPAHAELPSSCPDPASAWNGNNPWCYEWQGSWTQTAVSVPSADGPLAGTQFEPVDILPGARLPAVAVLHGLGGNQHNMWWLTRFLAGHGYIAVAVSTAGNQAPNFLHAMQGMVDFLRAPENPDAAHIDGTRIGAAGHSAGARATSWVQDADWAAHPLDRVRAVVALDNLTTNLGGDSGTYLLAPQCTTGVYTTPQGPIVSRVPAMGIASDTTAVTCPERNVVRDADAKKAAWSQWRHAGLPVIELVLRGADHLSFDQDISRVLTGESYLHLTGELTQRWFDGYLNGDPTALPSLLGPDLFGAPRDEQLSTQFRSAAFVPGVVDCADFTLAACPPT